jgi:hypothetical protein
MIINTAINKSDYKKVWNLTYSRYLSQGYCGENENKELQHYPHLDMIPETTVFMLWDNDKNLIGTNSLTIDGIQGLPIDDDFRDIVNKIRQECGSSRLLAASWRIVTQENNSFDIILKLIQATVEYSLTHGISTMLFAFNPKHIKIYKNLLGLHSIGEGYCKSANHNPAVLMRGNAEEVRISWGKTCIRRGISFNL